MRYELNQQLFVVHFTYPQIAGSRAILLYRQPMLYDAVVPTHCNFTSLTVKKHFKVRSKRAAEDATPECDGYLLTDEQGLQFSNQYPTASYGQTTDTADRRFERYSDTEGEVLKLYKEQPDFIYQYHLLSDLLEDIQTGIEKLDICEGNQEAKEKAAALGLLYKQIVNAFHLAYPAYQIELTWEPTYEGSTLIWPSITFVKTP